VDHAKHARHGSVETLLVFATHVATLLLTVAAQAVLARVLGTDSRGEYAVLLLFGTTAGVLFTLGADRASQYFAMAQKMPMWRAIASAALIVVIGSAVAAVLALPIIGSDTAFFRQATRQQFLHTLPLIPVSGLLTLLQLHAAGRRHFGSLAMAALFQGISNLVLLSVLSGIGGLGTVGAIHAQTLSSMVAACIIAYVLSRLERPSLRTSIDSIRTVVTYGSKYYVARVGNLFDLGMGTILLATVADSASIGIFAAVSALTLKTFLISESVEAVVLPRIAADPDQRVDLVLFSFRVSTFTVAIVAAMLCAVAPVLVPLLFSTAFSPGIGIVWALAPGLVLQGGAGILMAYYRGTNKPEICSLAVWIGLTVNILVFIALYDSLGMYAAGVAMSMGFLARSIFLTRTFCRTLGLKLRVLYTPRRSDVELLLQAVAALGARLASPRPRKS